MRSALCITLLICIAFGWWQNHHSSVGGTISNAKVLWLSLALSSFFVLPAFLWQDKGLSKAARRIFGLFLLGFVLRSVAEVPMLWLWKNWRCGYGIAHDVIMAVPILMLWHKSVNRARTSSELAFGRFLLAILSCEVLNAWLFSSIASPLEGVYFAADSPIFRIINAITWAEVAVLYPTLACLIYRHSRLR